MQLKDLRAGMGKVDVIVDVVEVKPSRTFEKSGSGGKVANATVQDATGKMTVSLWNEQVEQVKVGDKIHITNGYVSEFRGEKQLSTGKFGKLEIVGKTAPKEMEYVEDLSSQEELEAGDEDLDFEADSDD